MEDHNKCGRLGLEYPCQWLYKVIGSDPEQIRSAIAEVIKDAECSITHSNSSSTGKYHCLNLEIAVPSEESRDQMYQDLKSNPCIRMVL